MLSVLLSTALFALVIRDAITVLLLCVIRDAITALFALVIRDAIIGLVISYCMLVWLTFSIEILHVDLSIYLSYVSYENLYARQHNFVLTDIFTMLQELYDEASETNFGWT